MSEQINLDNFLSFDKIEFNYLGNEIIVREKGIIEVIKSNGFVIGIYEEIFKRKLDLEGWFVYLIKDREPMIHYNYRGLTAKELFDNNFIDWETGKKVPEILQQFLEPNLIVVKCSHCGMFGIDNKKRAESSVRKFMIPYCKTCQKKLGVENET